MGLHALYVKKTPLFQDYMGYEQFFYFYFKTIIFS